ncbi:MAG: AraC family transcriptional regulator [Myxococcota bacterium]
MDPYMTRILKSLHTIEEHLDETLDLDQLAQSAGLSRYHYHRMFTAMVGEPVMVYVRRRRLTQAAVALLETDRRIIDIALEAQFQSQQAFTRAFKKVFHRPPGVFRSQGQPLPILHRVPLTLDDLQRLTQGGLMDPKIVERHDPITIVGLSGTFAHGDSGSMGALWERFAPHIHTLRQPSDPCAYGVCLETTDDPVKALTYMAGVEVKAERPVPEGMTQARIEPGLYAVFTHRGPIGSIGESIRFIWGTWLPRSEYELGTGPDFEYYDERFHPGSDDSEVDIYVPIRRSSP